MKEGGDTTSGRSNDGWMKPKESPKRQTNTYYPPDLVTLAPDHVNGVRRSRANEVMDQSQDMMIKSLLDIKWIYTNETLYKHQS